MMVSEVEAVKETGGMVDRPEKSVGAEDPSDFFYC
jgi:hypothetical protein